MHEAYPVCVEQIHDAWSTVYHMVTTFSFLSLKTMIFFFTQNFTFNQKEVLQACGLVSAYLVFVYLIASYLS